MCPKEEVKVFRPEDELKKTHFYSFIRYVFIELPCKSYHVMHSTIKCRFNESQFNIESRFKVQNI